ncbi:hypothetical protein FRC10_009418, partial [Ceratobasidium sp. 414]
MLPPPKKSKVPITISQPAQPSTHTFQLPTPTAPTVAWLSAPEETLDGHESSETGSWLVSPAAAAMVRKASKPGTNVGMTLDTKGKGSSILQLCSWFVLEGKVDGLAEGMRQMTENFRALGDGAKECDVVAAECDAATNRQLDQQNEKLNQLLTLAEPFLPPQPAQPNTPTDARMGVLNPPATPELWNLVKEVCLSSAVRAQVGKKEKDNELNRTQQQSSG